MDGVAFEVKATRGRHWRLGQIAVVLFFAGLSAHSFSACRDGYQPQGAFYDYALGRTWTVLARCGHAEMPRLAVDLEASEGEALAAAASLSRPSIVTAISSASSPVGLRQSLTSAGTPSAFPVLAGGSVRLWKQDSRARIELAGVALESGALGAPVRVRINRSNGNGQVLRGVVRGNGSVELAEVQGFSGGLPGGSSWAGQ